MYIGSTGLDGLHHITLEIISNAIDEYLNGHCTNCDIEIDNNGYITIQDNGRGVPFGKAKDGSETLVNIYTKLHTGAKFDSDGKNGYNTSGGMNGVGAKATNALSEKFIVISHRENKKATGTFAKGKLISYIEETDDTVNKNGTIIKFLPDKEIFKDGITLNYSRLKAQIQELSYLSPGLTFTLKLPDDEEKIIIVSNRGIQDYIDDLNKDKNTITSVFYTETYEDRIGVKIAVQYNDSYTDVYKLYTNSIPNSGGTHLTGFRAALTSTLNSYAKEKGWLKEKDANFIGDELKEGLTLVLSFIMPDPVFSGQTKDILSSSEARTIVQRLVAQELDIWFKANPKEAKAICEKALNARKAREAAKKARENVRSQEKKKEKALKFDSKIADCYSKSRAKCEIYVTEGDSASGTLKTARNNEFQAVMPLRGKILNCQKATLEQIQKNAEIVTMIEAFGLQMNPKTMKLMLDPEELRYGKIIIAADGDVDGSHIRNLFYTFIWNFCPELITGGYVYSLVAPLYKVTVGKDTYIYLKDDTALEEWRTANPNKKYVLSRFKGLGEMSAEETEVLVDPALRTLCQVTVEDVTAANRLFEDLMGLSVTPRKKFIQEHSAEAKYE